MNKKTPGFPGGSDGKESDCSVGDLGSIPGLGRSSGEGRQPTPVLWPGEFHGQRSLGGPQSMGLQRVRHNWVTFTQWKHFSEVFFCHKIHLHNIRMCMYILVIKSIHIVVQDHHQPSLELFHLPKLKLYSIPIKQLCISPLSLWHPPFSFLFLSLNNLGTSHNWNYTVFVFL